MAVVSGDKCGNAFESIWIPIAGLSLQDPVLASADQRMESGVSDRPVVHAF